MSPCFPKSSTGFWEKQQRLEQPAAANRRVVTGHVPCSKHITLLSLLHFHSSPMGQLQCSSWHQGGRGGRRKVRHVFLPQGRDVNSDPWHHEGVVLFTVHATYLSESFYFLFIFFKILDLPHLEGKEIKIKLFIQSHFLCTFDIETCMDFSLLQASSTYTTFFSPPWDALGSLTVSHGHVTQLDG